ncbi:TPA: hypothetical protein I7234_11420 [Vibrio vulnificus]|uniref:hypothetical protein n=2 Tax=Gammaproteobacteria TaxID=1236 RepID=UPI000CD3071F|nr:hypothetical protein [Vibrio vulnificus]POB15794.1 hypothetical protein CRN36_22630 [Vibrio vulnificus]HAS6018957.1 hypothetical protein [Vibrio vulnificus]HAS6352851.1 hypothetical protein [Vibrio vulnificus]HAS6366495.1 hypothetical protein [Vibrio vulnificus]HDY7610363.1 hypothetical protein [Vibrio vulnificus]
MYDHLAFISGDWVTDAIILTTAAVFLFFSFREFVAVIKTKIQLKGLGKIKLEASSNVINSKSLKKEQLVWVTDHLVYAPTQDGIVVETKGDLWLTKSPISQMLPSIDSSRYKLIPALLTSIGITGTFLGITLGLSEFTMAGDSKALLASAAELLEGMKTAFYTSLAGLGTSALFMVWMKISSSVLAKAQKELISTLSSQYFEASPIYYLKNISNEGQKEVLEAQLRSASAVELMGEKMEATSHSLTQLGTSFNGEVIAKQISTALAESIETSMTPMLGEIKQELSALKDIKEQSQKELVELLIQEMKSELIAPVAEGLSKTSAAVTSSNEITSQLNSNIERVVTSTSETVDTINEFQKETMLKLQSFAESLKVILASFKEDTQGAMTSIASEVNTMLNNASQGMDSQRVAFEQSANKAASAFEGMKNSLEAALDERQSAEKDLFENVTGRINDLLSDISTSFESQTSVLAQTGETASQMMTQAQKDFEMSVQQRREEESKMFVEVESRLSNLVENAAKGIENQQSAFEQSADKASSAFEGMKNSLEAALDERQSAEKVLFENVTGRINRLLSEISSSFENQTSVLAQTGETASNLMNQAQKDFEVSVQMRRDEESHLFGEMESRITGLVQNSQAIFQEQAEAIKLVGNEASSVMQSAKSELQQGLGDIDSKVKSMSETVLRELEAFRLQYQENLTRYFEQQNDLLEDSLSKQRNGLNDVVDNFRNVFESEYKARHNLLQELTAQYEKLEASAGTLERVAKAIGLNEASKMAELQDAAHTMSREIALLKKEYSQASATFADVTENLPKAMDEYFTRANESFESFFNDFDQSASKIHNKLSQAAGYLINSQVQRRQIEADEANA